MVVTARNHVFVTARAQPKLVTVAMIIRDDGIHLDVPGMPRLELKKNLPMKDASILESKYVNKSCTLDSDNVQALREITNPDYWSKSIYQMI